MNELLPARLPLDDLMAEAGYVARDAFARAAGDACAWLLAAGRVEAQGANGATR